MSTFYRPPRSAAGMGLVFSAIALAAPGAGCGRMRSLPSSPGRRTRPGIGRWNIRDTPRAMKTVRHEITRWITRESALMGWSGIGEVIDPNSPDAVRNQVVEMVAPELVRQQLLPPATK
jgi:hypothetical protein